MWTYVKKSLARFKSLNQVLGDVAFETPEIKGTFSHSFLQLRIKKSLEGDQYFVALRMRPDSYAGPEGSPTNYMNFDIEAAQRLKFNLDLCISEYYRLAGDASARNI